MLKLCDITKKYITGDTEVQALNGVSIEFGEKEFVAILGPSGCGKTTLLNIIGGLDRYTDGDLVINGISTKKFRSGDWDAYRNHSIGFVFQSYQLIPHQSVLNNVELTMTLSGISKAERRRKAVEALEKVGLKDQIHKRPNQMSGGQMQRAAIARALVNDPDIILADEPTGALDTKTSVQIMDILKEVSENRLVIMVTHNPELAEKYATRIIRLTDGEVISDDRTETAEAAPDEAEVQAEIPTGKEAKRAAKKLKKKRSMSLLTAISLSLNNLMTKKGRTFLTAFAGAIGIIGIAMILALSTGVQNYIDRVESDTLSSYPLQINRETVDFTEMMASMIGDQPDKGEEEEKADPEDETITEIRSSNMMTDMIGAVANGKTENDLGAFKKFAEGNEELEGYVQAIEYRYATTLNAYNTDAAYSESGIEQVNPSTVMSDIGMGGQSGAGMMGGQDIFSQLPAERKLTETMYEVIDGRFPENYDEVVLAVTERGTIGDYALYALGLLDREELKTVLQDVMAGNEVEKKERSVYTFDELEGLSLSVLPNTCYFEKQEDGTYLDRTEDEDYIKEQLADNGITLKVVGIVCANRDSTGSEAGSFGGILYTPALMQELIARISASEIVKAQEEHPETDVFTGIDFPKDDEEAEPLTMEGLQAYMMTLPEADAANMQGMIAGMKQQGKTDEEILAQFEPYLNRTTDATYDGNMDLLGVSDPEHPDTILIYPKDFETKEKIVDLLDRYSADLPEGQDLKYTDYVGLIMSSVTRIINVITYILVGFVGISLVVSSIMIGIITYISVLERTREIGILRSIGASKHDISRVFNAETLLIGFVSGLIGVAVPYLISIFVNALVYEHFEVENIMHLAPEAAVVLVIISMLLTFIGGLIPSGIAAKKDPVEALRTE